MRSRKFYNDILLDLHFRQTHDLRTILNTTKNLRRKALSREFLNSSIEQIQLEITNEDIKHSFKYEFIDLDVSKVKWKIEGRGVHLKKKNFINWYKKEKEEGMVRWFFNGKFPENLIYVFYGVNKKCLYVGRTGNGGSRPVSHFNKYWFNRVKEIEIIHTSNSKRINKMECLAIHYYQPIYNLKKSARQARTQICPICDKQKEIEKSMRKIFKARK